MTRALPHALSHALNRTVALARPARGGSPAGHQPAAGHPRGAATGRHRAERPRTGVRHATVAAVTVAAAGVAVATGVGAGDPASGSGAGSAGSDLAAAALSAAESTATADPGVLDRLRSERSGSISRSAERTSGVSRSADRAAVDRTKLRRLKGEARSGGQVTRTKDLGSGDPKDIARSMLGGFGFSADQFGCLDSLWTRESGWNPRAQNASSSAYGIPQALPGSKMATAGADWATNPATQIRWGLGYIRDRYGSPCAAWSHSEGYGWY